MMGSIWAVAKQTFTQCLRMKVAVAFLVLLAVTLGVLPFLMTGDDTLVGRIRTFLDYAPSITGLLLMLVTMFLAVGVVSGDVRNKYIYTLAAKPLARWQYILGRWLGLVALNAVLLTVAGVAMYGLAQYLRAQPAVGPDDRRAVETEVFTARRRVRPEPLEPIIEANVTRRIEEMRQAGELDEAVNAFKPQAGGDPARAMEMLVEEFSNQVRQRLQSTGPGRMLQWAFDDIRVQGTEVRATGTIVEKGAIADGPAYLRVEAPPAVLGRLVHQGPVRINGVDGRVVRQEETFFDVGVMPEDVEPLRLEDIETPAEAELIVDPAIQLTFEATPSRPPPEGILQTQWQLLNPTTGLLMSASRSVSPRTPSTMTVSARLVDEQGRLIVRYINVPHRETGFATSVMIPRDDITVLYRVGSFEANFLRGMLLLLVRMSFIAAVGVLAGSVLSFPVGVLACFSVLPFGLARNFLGDATVVYDPGQVDVFTVFGRAVYVVMRALLPDLARTAPGGAFVDGMMIPWTHVATTAGLALGVRAAVALLLACVLFHRRELARVQV